MGTLTLGSTSSSDFSISTSMLEYVLLSYEESLSSTKFIADIYNVSLLTLSEVLALSSLTTTGISFSVSVYDSMIFIFSGFYIDFLERAVDVPTFLMGACISIWYSLNTCWRSLDRSFFFFWPGESIKEETEDDLVMEVDFWCFLLVTTSSLVTFFLRSWKTGITDLSISS